PDEKQLASISSEGAIKIWDYSEVLKKVRLLPDGRLVAAWDPNGNRIAIGYGKNQPGALAGVWNLETGNLQRLPGQGGWCHQIDWSPDGNRIAMGGLSRGNLEFWDVTEEGFPDSALKSVPVSTGQMRGRYEWLPDSKQILALDAEAAIQRVDSETGAATILKYDDEPIIVHPIRWKQSHDGTKLAYDQGDRVLIRDLDSGEIIDETEISRPANYIWSPDDRMVVVSSELGEIRIRDIESKRWVAELIGHSRYVGSMDWHPNGRRLVSSGIDQTVRIWELDFEAESFQQMAVLRYHEGEIYEVAWSPDGRQLLTTGRDHRAMIWSAD
ncbi:MAG: hypothetical protein AAF585_25495, partial [Verrucomicrobiota bacterium]